MDQNNKVELGGILKERKGRKPQKNMAPGYVPKPTSIEVESGEEITQELIKRKLEEALEQVEYVKDDSDIEKISFDTHCLRSPQEELLKVAREHEDRDAITMLQSTYQEKLRQSIGSPGSFTQDVLFYGDYLYILSQDWEFNYSDNSFMETMIVKRMDLSNQLD